MQSLEARSLRPVELPIPQAVRQRATYPFRTKGVRLVPLGHPLFFRRNRLYLPHNNALNSSFSAPPPGRPSAVKVRVWGSCAWQFPRRNVSTLRTYNRTNSPNMLLFVLNVSMDHGVLWTLMATTGVKTRDVFSEFRQSARTKHTEPKKDGRPKIPSKFSAKQVVQLVRVPTFVQRHFHLIS